MIADGALEHERDVVRAVVQVVEDLRVGGLGVGMIDPLHHAQGEPGARPAIGRASCARGRAARWRCRHRSWT